MMMGAGGPLTGQWRLEQWLQGAQQPSWPLPCLCVSPASPLTSTASFCRTTGHGRRRPVHRLWRRRAAPRCGGCSGLVRRVDVRRECMPVAKGLGAGGEAQQASVPPCAGCGLPARILRSRAARGQRVVRRHEFGCAAKRQALSSCLATWGPEPCYPPPPTTTPTPRPQVLDGLLRPHHQPEALQGKAQPLPNPPCLLW